MHKIKYKIYKTYKFSSIKLDKYIKLKAEELDEKEFV